MDSFLCETLLNSPVRVLCEYTESGEILGHKNERLIQVAHLVRQIYHLLAFIYLYMLRLTLQPVLLFV